MHAIPSSLDAPLPVYTIPYPVSRFSVEQYHEMIAAGMLTEDDNVELLEGWITPMMSKGPAHELAIEMLDEELRALLPRGMRVRIQSAMTTIDSEPEPDFLIAKCPPNQRLGRHPMPADIAMIVEVAESSIGRDRSKCRLYARAEIPVYWILNLNARQLEVYTQPSGPSDSPGYAQQTVYRAGNEAPLMIDGQPLGVIKIDAILP